MQIEGSKQAIGDLPMTVGVQERLRETARFLSTHYSTQIEGNRLTLEQTQNVVKKQAHFPERERDEKEVLGYYQALEKVESRLFRKGGITELKIRTLHSLLMAGGKKRVKPTPYRKGQNVIRDSATGRIVYLPPEAKDVSRLMKDLVKWLGPKNEFPCPIRAGIAHYQIATIHPYFDGNGRLARLVATLILYQGGYDLKGFYSLEEYYVRDLSAYYRAIAVGPSHNYYEGRAEAEITPWLEYFTQGMAHAFSKVETQARNAANTGEVDQTSQLRQLDARQRRVLSLFKKSKFISVKEVAKLFGLAGRSARLQCQNWTQEGFLVVANASKKGRKYRLRSDLEVLLGE